MNTSSRALILSGFRLALIGPALIGIALTLAATAAANETIYTWTDENGVRHFAAQPPEGRDYRLVQTLGAVVAQSGQDIGGERDTPAPTQLPEVSQAPPDPDLVRERCDQARGNLDLLEQDRPALLQQEDGEPQPLDDQTRREMIEETRAFIAEWC